MFTSSRTTPISVAEASPMWELWAQTTALESGPRQSSSRSRVSNMCRSRRFQLSREP